MTRQDNPQAGQNPPGRILVVDDEPHIRQLMRSLLETEGYVTIEAADGVQALDIIGSENPVDLVLLDIMMPGLDGIEVCRRIRRDMGRLTLPVVFVTALTDRASRIGGREAGADDYLSKPIDNVELLARVRNLLLVKAYHDLRENQRLQLAQELERAQAQLIQHHRLALLGTLAGCVGHELKNITGVLKGTVHFIEQSCKEQRPIQEEDRQRLQRVVEHLTNHSSNLLRLGRPGAHDDDRFDVCEVIYSSMNMLGISGKTKRVQVVYDLPDMPLYIEANCSRFEQVLINLVSNAADAFDDVQDREAIIEVGARGRGDEGIRLWVSDNGVGIAEDQQAAVFDSYFTTKGPARGTGLGLQVVEHFVDDYGGSVDLTSTLGQGTTFTIDLPRAPSSGD